MPYRNGTYVAFHAEGSRDPTASDIRYYRMLMAWHSSDNSSFRLINSHEKVAAVRDSSARATLRRSLMERLNNSSRMILIIGNTTKADTDWVPFEIEYAVDVCKIPIIAAYPGYTRITDPSALRPLWPGTLLERIDGNTARVIHIPFKQSAIDDAMSQFNNKNMPATSLNYYSEAAHRSLGLT